MPNSPGSLERLFHSNIRMTPSKSRRPSKSIQTKRAAMNRSAHIRSELFAALNRHGPLTVGEFRKLYLEYIKLLRRIINNSSANLKTGHLSNNEKARVRREKNIVKNMSVAIRTTKRLDLPQNIRTMIVNAMPRTHS
jgi:hypothetical protein